MKRKIVAMIVAVSMMGLTLAACGSDSNDAESTSGETAESEAGEDGEETESFVNADGEYEWPLLDEVKADESRTSTANSDERYDSVAVSIATVPADLSPYTMSNAITNMEVFDTLLDQADSDEFIGRMAKEWEHVDDTHFVVEIYDYIYDSDGNNITASDVVFSFNTYNDSGYARDYNYFESVEEIDDYTVEFTWREPIEGLTNFASMITKTYIVSEKAYNDHDFITEPIGSGPYEVEEYVTASYVTLKAKDEYWQTEEDLVSPNALRNVERIRYDFISDQSMAAIAFENGDTINVSLDENDLEMFEEGGEYADLGNLYCYLDTVSLTILPNMSGSSVTSDLDFRMACFYAFDSEGFAASLGERLYAPVSVDVSPAVSDYSKDWEELDSYQNSYNPELAQEYLEKSEYNGEKLVILIEGNEQKSNIATVMQAYLTAIGVDSEIKTYDHALISGYAADPEGWDFFIASAGDGDYTANRLRKVYGDDTGYTEGLNISLDDDETFYNMIADLNTVSGNSAESTKETFEYIYDNALGYGTAYPIKVECYDECVAEFVAKYGTSEIIYGACEYYLD